MAPSTYYAAKTRAPSARVARAARDVAMTPVITGL